MYILYNSWMDYVVYSLKPSDKIIKSFKCMTEVKPDEIPYKEGYRTSLHLDNLENVIFEFVKIDNSDEVDNLNLKVEILSDTLDSLLELQLGGIE